MSSKPSAEEIKRYEEVLINCKNKKQTEHLSQTKYFQYLALKCDIKTPNDWYKCRRSNFIRWNGEFILSRNRGSYILAIMNQFPDHTWYFWKFPTPSKILWTHENQREYVKWLAHTVNPSMDMEGWHYLTKFHFQKNYGNYFIDNYKSIYEVISTLFPEYNWKIWKFEKFEKIVIEYFLEFENQRKFLLSLKDEVGFRDWEDFYKMDYSHLKRFGCLRLIKRYSSSLAKTVITILNDKFAWQSWRFKINPTKKVNIEFLCDYLDYLMETKGINNHNELIQKIDQETIRETHGEPIIKEFGGTMKSAVYAYENRDQYLNKPKRNTSKIDLPDENDDDDEFDDHYSFDNQKFNKKQK
eukprot:gene3710-4622_t